MTATVNGKQRRKFFSQEADALSQSAEWAGQLETAFFAVHTRIPPKEIPLHEAARLLLRNKDLTVLEAVQFALEHHKPVIKKSLSDIITDYETARREVGISESQISNVVKSARRLERWLKQPFHTLTPSDFEKFMLSVFPNPVGDRNKIDPEQKLIALVCGELATLPFEFYPFPTHSGIEINRPLPEATTDKLTRLLTAEIAASNRVGILAFKILGDLLLHAASHQKNPRGFITRLATRCSVPRQALYDAMFVCRRIPRNLRNGNLSWSHYCVIARKAPEDKVHYWVSFRVRSKRPG